MFGGIRRQVYIHECLDNYGPEIIFLNFQSMTYSRRV